jgi:hypothetical protein
LRQAEGAEEAEGAGGADIRILARIIMNYLIKREKRSSAVLAVSVESDCFKKGKG